MYNYIAEQFALYLIIDYDIENFNIMWSYYDAMANTSQVINISIYSYISLIDSYCMHINNVIIHYNIIFIFVYF